MGHCRPKEFLPKVVRLIGLKVAPPDKKDGAEKYKDWPFEKLKEECKKRNIKFNDSDNKDKLIYLLCEDDRTLPNWGKIYARLLYHTGMGYEEIERRTIPQIIALLNEAEENIAIKIGMPGIFGGALDNPPPTSSPTGKPPKLSEFAAFCSAFDGIS